MQPDQAPDGLDLERPNPARIYDYLLGGSNNLPVDRGLASHAIEAVADLPAQALANRAFMHRAVRFLVNEAGVSQFLDLGSGIVSFAGVHEVAQAADPLARVAYIDWDDVAVLQGQEVVADNPNAIAVRGDVCRPDKILADPRVTDLLDFSRPVAVLAIAVMEAIGDDDDPAGIISALYDGVSPGSFFVMSHGTKIETFNTDPVEDMWRRAGTPVTFRSPDQVRRLFAKFSLVYPGLVWAPLWRPVSPYAIPNRPERSAHLAGVGTKPAA